MFTQDSLYYRISSNKIENNTIATIKNNRISLNQWYELDSNKSNKNDIKSIINKIHSLKEFV
jgi:hypothetical protein